MTTKKQMFTFCNFHIDGKGVWRPLTQRQIEQTKERIYFKTILEVDRDPDDLSSQSFEALEDVQYYGPFYLDFDGSSIAEVLADVGVVIDKMVHDWDLDRKYINAWLSGKKGVHLTINPLVFGLTQSCKHLPKIYEQLAKSFGDIDTLDMSVYSSGKGRMWRCPGLMRSNGKYKVPIPVDLLLQICPEEYLQMISAPRDELYQHPVNQVFPDAVDAFKKARTAAAAKQKSFYSGQTGIPKGTFSPSDIPGCIQILVKNGDRKGSNFNRAAMTLASFIAEVYRPEEKDKYNDDLVEPFCSDTSSSTYNSAISRFSHVNNLIRRAFMGKLQFRPQYVLAAIDTPCGNCPICSRVAPKNITGGSDITAPNSYIAITNGKTYIIDQEGKRKLILNGALVPKLITSTSVLNGVVVEEGNVAATVYDAVTALGDKREVSVPIETWSNAREFVKLMNQHDITNKPTDAELQELRMFSISYARANKTPKKVLVKTNGIVFEKIDEVKTKPHFVESGESFSSTGKSHFRFDTEQATDISTYINKVTELAIGDEEADKALLALCNMNKSTHIAQMLGWMAACHIKQHLFTATGCFPLLSLVGAPGTGKTAQAQLMANIAGLSPDVTGAAISCESSNPKPIKYLLKSSTTIPRILDEVNGSRMRSEKWQEINGILKAAWGNQVAAQGAVKNNQVVIETDRLSAPVVILSEEPQSEAALLTRLLNIPLTHADRLPKTMKDSYREATQSQGHLLRIAKALINEAVTTDVSDILSVYRAIEAKIPEEVFSPRSINARATVLTGLRFLMKTLKRYQLSSYDKVEELYHLYFSEVVNSVKPPAPLGVIDNVLTIFNNIAKGLVRGVRAVPGSAYFCDDEIVYLNLQDMTSLLGMAASALGYREYARLNYQQLDSMIRESQYYRGTIPHPNDSRIMLLKVSLKEFHLSKGIVLSGFDLCSL